MLLQRTEGTTFQERTVRFSLPFLPGLNKACSTLAQASPSLAQEVSRAKPVAVASKGGDSKAPSSSLLAGQEQAQPRPCLPSSTFPLLWQQWGAQWWLEQVQITWTTVSGSWDQAVQRIPVIWGSCPCSASSCARWPWSCSNKLLFSTLGVRNAQKKISSVH